MPRHGVAGLAEDEGRIDALDGLRGLAILLVMIFHLTLVYPFGAAEKSILYMAGGIGWIGVDLFFVLSGFLITGILIDTKDNRNFFSNFFARRTLRIFPLYYATLIVVFLLMPAAGYFNTPELNFIREHQVFSWTYMTNWGFVAAGGARFFNVEWLTLIHFWSLAIEEQFYLAWPFAVYFLNRRKFVGLCILLMAGAVCGRLAVAALGIPQGAAYTLTPFRIDTLVTGALIAVAVRDGTAKHRVFAAAPWAAAIAATLVLSVFMLRDGVWFADRWMHTLGFSVLAIGWGGLLVMCLPDYRGGGLGLLFKPHWLRFFGKYSYGLYVIHPFVLAHFSPAPFARFGMPEPLAACLYIACGIVAFIVPAWLSWHLLEKHFLKLKRFFASAPDMASPKRNLVRT
ncbi:MAG TPA: acyltransferase [Shinella sp.]|jgi:peptidoglycan/LPS O-acetylase OafA/YrhL|uniref:acyltransferase family protein n=1 Tax=Shinella sp. TaxID=1870904 RepID=UPI002E160860|nr:acyltransferase [Shinella sp.]